MPVVEEPSLILDSASRWYVFTIEHPPLTVRGHDADVAPPRPAPVLPMRILLIEDNDALRTVMCRTLAPVGYDVQEASDGKAGLIAYRAQRSDVVITDIVMPEADGLETIGALLRFDPAVKIIAISGGGQGSAGDYLETARKMGARRILVKPFTPEQLRTAVADLLAQVGG